MSDTICIQLGTDLAFKGKYMGVEIIPKFGLPRGSNIFVYKNTSGNLAINFSQCHIENQAKWRQQHIASSYTLAGIVLKELFIRKRTEEYSEIFGEIDGDKKVITNVLFDIVKESLLCKKNHFTDNETLTPNLALLEIRKLLNA